MADGRKKKHDRKGINLAIKLFDRLPYFYSGPSNKIIAQAIVNRTV